MCIYVGWPKIGETAPFPTDRGKKANWLRGRLYVCPLLLSVWQKVLWREVRNPWGAQLCLAPSR